MNVLSVQTEERELLTVEALLRGDQASPASSPQMQSKLQATFTDESHPVASPLSLSYNYAATLQLAKAQAEQLEYDKAIELLQQAAEQAKAQFGHGHLISGIAWVNIAIVLTQQHKHNAALSLLLSALPILEQHLGPDHASVNSTKRLIDAAHETIKRPGDTLVAASKSRVAARRTLVATQRGQDAR